MSQAKYRAKWFSDAEMACRCCDCLPLSGMDERLMRLLDKLRDKWGKPIYVTSGYRCRAHNFDVGGVTGSYHCMAKAVDIIPPEGVECHELAAVAMDLGFDGIGLYSDDGFVHLDTRGYRAMW